MLTKEEIVSGKEVAAAAAAAFLTLAFFMSLYFHLNTFATDPTLAWSTQAHGRKGNAPAVEV